MKLVEEILETRGGELMEVLVGRVGFGRSEAERFLPLAVTSVVESLASQPGINLSDFDNNFPPVLQQIDLPELAERARLDATLVTVGISALVPTLLTSLKQRAGGTQDLAAILEDLGDSDAEG